MSPKVDSTLYINVLICDNNEMEFLVSTWHPGSGREGHNDRGANSDRTASLTQI